MIGTFRAVGIRRLARNYLSLKGTPAYMGNLGMLRERLQALKTGAANEASSLNAGMREEDKLVLEQLAYFGDLAYSSRSSEKHSGLKQQLEKELEENYIQKLESRIGLYNAEELIAFLDISRAVAKSDAYNNHVVNRFCRLVERHIQEGLAGFETKAGQLQVTFRTLETHSFARLVHQIFFLRTQLTQEQLLKLKPLIDNYLYKETKNISLEDHMLVLSALLNYFEPYEVHSDFLQNKLPVAKVSNCSTFVLLVDLIANLSFLPQPGKLLNDEQAFDSVNKFLVSQVPYMSDWPSPELSSYVVASVVSLSKSRFRVSEAVLDVIQEGFFYFSGSFSSKQKLLYLQALLENGLLISSGPNFEQLFRPIEEDIVSDVRKERIEEIVSFLSILNRIDAKNNELLIFRVLGELDAKLEDDSFTKDISKSTARRLLDLLQNAKSFRNLNKSKLQTRAAEK